jgi:hypothetical protein
METTEYWIQAALFPDFSLVFWAYEVDCFGNGDCYWEIFDDSGFLQSIEPENFGDFLDFCRSINYDVLINTQESWEAMINDDY